jgi:hypothetical protein
VDHSSRLQALRAWQRLLDNRFKVPGTQVRFGWDPIIGLIPWAGDVVTALFACAIVFQAHQMRVPRVVQLRMLTNVGIDVLVGIVPFLGDVADVFWKANSRNMAILEMHAARPQPATAGDWLFVAGVIATILLVAIVPIAVMYWLLHVVLQRPLI